MTDLVVKSLDEVREDSPSTGWNPAGLFLNRVTGDDQAMTNAEFFDGIFKSLIPIWDADYKSGGGYDYGNPVTGSDGKIYISVMDANTTLCPPTEPGGWQGFDTFFDMITALFASAPH